MGAAGGPNATSNGLVLAIDAFNRKGVSPLGNDLFNTAPSLVKSILTPSQTIQQANGVHVGNLSYYTAFSIDYPEGSYGGDAAGRDGITSGLNVRGGSKIFDFGRALNYAVYDNITQAWVKTTVYDSYVGTAAVDTFVSEYATAVSTYPDAVHIVAGSHRDSYHTTAQYNILKDLGAPSNVDTLIGFSSPEWILVGKPGLGTGNAYGWAFQNYPTNSDFVAHLNFGLPIYGNKDNYFKFDGVDDYLNVGSFNPNFSAGITMECMAYWTSSPGGSWQRMFDIGNGSSADNLLFCRYSNGDQLFFGIYNGGSTSYVTSGGGAILFGQYALYTAVADGTDFKIYVNGSLIYSGANTTIPVTTPRVNGYIGKSNWPDSYFNGQIPMAKIYNRPLTATEVAANFQAVRKRFGI